MTLLVFLKMLTAMACVALATTIVVRDPDFKPNRLMGGLMACVGWWALCEVLWTVADSPETALTIARSSSFGWMPVSAFLFHTYAELHGNRRLFLHRLTPLFYGLSLGLALAHTLTPWGLVALSPVPPFSWKLEFGWLFLPGLATAVVPPVIVLFAWHRSTPRNGSGGERRTAWVVLASMSAAVVVAIITDAILPMLGTYLPLMGSTAVAGACGVIALHLQRYGFSLLSADAFAEEIIGSLPDGVALVRRDGTIRYVNPILADLVGISTADARRISIHDLMPRLPLAIEELEPGTELVLRCTDGRGLPVVVSTVAVTHERRGIVGFALIVRDRRDVAALRRRLVNSARLAAVGDLSSGIAREIMRPMLDVRASLHDLKLHWQVIGLDVAKAQLGGQAAEILEEGDDLIGESLEGVDRVTSLVRSVQGFGASSEGRLEETCVNELVEHALRIALSSAGPRTSLDVELASDLAPVACRRGDLERVLVNLVVNAFHAVGDEGRVVVSTEARDGGVSIRVTDDGCGIPTSLRDRIFDPFFTTKPVGEGTGLGLAICYHIVRNHGGSIDVDSARGHGTTFTIELPAA